MIERHLPDGTIAEFDDDTPPEEIARALRDYVRSLRAAAAAEPRTDAEGARATPPAAAKGKQRIQRPSNSASGGVSREPAPPPEPEPSPNGRQRPPTLRLTNVEPFSRDETDETPEVVRERLQRAGRPARLDPPDEISDPFRDNLHATWSVRYWPR